MRRRNYRQKSQFEDGDTRKGVENIQNRRKGLYKKGVEKKRAGEGCDPQKKLCDDLKAFI